jgi:hypothetical protein
LVNLKFAGLIANGLVLGIRTPTLAQQELPQPPSGFEDALAKVLQFLYTIAHWIGNVVAGIIQAILPSVRIPTDLVDTVGLLAMLTLFLLISEIAKKLTWIVVIVGWVLVLVRIVMLILGD